MEEQEKLNIEKELKELMEQEKWLSTKLKNDFRTDNQITIDKRFVEINQELKKVRERISEITKEILEIQGLKEIPQEELEKAIEEKEKEVTE